MSEVANYEIGISLKNAIRDLRRFKKIAEDFNKKLRQDQKASRKIESDNTRHLISEKRKQGQASKSVLAGMLREEHKAAAAKDKLLAKEKAQQQRFNTWRKSQQRRLIDSQLDQHQKMEIMRVLSTTKAEHEIRQEYDETLRKFRANKIKEVQAAKAADKLRVDSEKSTNARMAKLKAGAFAAAQVAAAAVTAGAAMIGMGGKAYADDKANSAAAGMDVQEFQQQQFKVTQATNVSGEKFADITKTANERKGSAQFLEKKKDGTFGGADAGATDFINSVQQKTGKDLSLEQAQNLLQQGGKTGIEGLMDMRKQMDALGMSMADQSFIMESYASDSWNLTEQFRRNQKAVQQAEEDFHRLGLGIQNLEAVDRVTNKFKQMFGVIKAAPTEAFESFASALSPETTQTLQVLTEKLIDFSRVIGERMAQALNWLSPILEKIMPLLDQLAPLFNYIAQQIGNTLSFLGSIFSVVVDSLTGSIKAIKQLLQGDFMGAFGTITDTLTNAFTGITDALKQAILGMIGNFIDFLPDSLVPDSFKAMIEKANAPTEPTVTPPPPSVTPPPPAIATTPPPQGSLGNVGNGGTQTIQNNNSTTVQVMLEGEKIAEVVSRSPSLHEVINRAVDQSFSYNYS